MDPEVDPELHTIPPDRGSMETQPKWRQDFPVDSAQDGYVVRREFTKFLGLTSLAFVVGQFCIAIQSRWRRSRDEYPTLPVTKIAGLQVGSALGFHYPTETEPAILLRLDATTFLAYSSQCTHLQCPVLPEIAKGRLHCPCHAGYFDLRTGRPLAGPPRRALPRISIEVREDTVYATGFEESEI